MKNMEEQTPESNMMTLEILNKFVFLPNRKNRFFGGGRCR